MINISHCHLRKINNLVPVHLYQNSMHNNKPYHNLLFMNDFFLRYMPSFRLGKSSFLSEIWRKSEESSAAIFDGTTPGSKGVFWNITLQTKVSESWYL